MILSHRHSGEAVLLILLLALATALPAVDVPSPGASSEAAVAFGNLDSSSFAEWVDGTESPVRGTGREALPEWVFWTEQTTPGHSGRPFGKSNRPGPRHLRIGFASPVGAGTVIVKGGGRLSVLKPDVPFPGDLSRDSDWIPAARLVGGKVSSAEVPPEEFAAWVLPPGTETRALRFSHEPEPTDTRYEGMLGGVLVLRDRFINVAPLAAAAVSASPQAANKINNGITDAGSAWQNVEQSNVAADAPVVSAERPEWIILTWPEKVELHALAALFAGFGAAEIQVYGGPEDRHPRDAAEGDWKSVAEFRSIRNGYPVPFWPNLMPFDADISVRALRVLITSTTTEGHPHLKGRTRDGRRVWIDELMALSALGQRPLEDLSSAGSPLPQPSPPIPVKFVLNEPGLVTLVIEKPDGQRVRNLVSETPFPAGENTAWWDGTDDLGRDTDAAKHGVYHIPARLVEPGEYVVRGLVRKQVVPRYEFSVYSAGRTAWNTPDKTGGWLSNHSPPQAAVFVPGGRAPGGEGLVYLGSYVSEGRDGVAWVDLDGKKQGGKTWVGGTWTGAPFLALDAGPGARAGDVVYAASVWETGKKTGKAELRVTALTGGEDRAVLKWAFEPRDPKRMSDEIAGLAAFDGIIAVSLPQQKRVLLIDAAGTELGSIPVDAGRGVAFDAQGRLSVVSGRRVLRYESVRDPARLPLPEEIVPAGLEDPQQLLFDPEGRLYVSDWGDSHQVKVFSTAAASGGWLDALRRLFGAPGSRQAYAIERTIGRPGAPHAGPYDPLHMNHPFGMALDSAGLLWVAEKDFLPKRVSVWSRDGALAKAFYGGPKYGGGGSLDPSDRNRFYYGEEASGTLAFQLDWEKGTSILTDVLYRPGPGDMKLAFRSAAPETAFHLGGRRYFTNCFNSNPVAGHGTAFLFLDKAGILKPVAAMGRAADWQVLSSPDFLPRWPEGMDPASRDAAKRDALFAWSDTNEDAQVQPDEVSIIRGRVGGVTVMPDLAFCLSRHNGNSVRYAPVGATASGVPAYDLGAPQILAGQVASPASSGGDQALWSPDGWAVVTLGISPFAQQSLCGAKDGKPMWSYPSAWPGLHAAHEAPVPDRPGQLIGTTRLLGGFFEARGSDAGPLWAVNGNLGTVYVFTADGLFVATLFRDARIAKLWSMPVAERLMRLDGITLNEENFWPTISSTPEGGVFLVDGARSSIVRIEGMETIRRLPSLRLNVTPGDLERAGEFRAREELARQQEHGAGVLKVPILRAKPIVDGRTGEWKWGWADIDRSGVKANFNSDSKPYNISGSLAVAGDRLFAAFRTGDPKLADNSGESASSLFKTGGGLDLMIGADPSADPRRSSPAAGDMRLIVSLVKGTPRAILYRAVVPGTLDADKVPFSSPWRTITFDKVEDLSAQVEFAGRDGDFEFSIPLAALKLQPQEGLRLKGDLGVLRGEPGQTTARTYWANKATGITADVPSEAMLAPALWGTFEFQREE